MTANNQVAEASVKYLAEAAGKTVPAGYKQTDAGVIPEDWNLQRVADGIRLISGHHVLAHFCNTRGKGFPYLTGPADFSNGFIFVSKYTERPTSICEAGDILITVKGSGAGSLIEADDIYCISRQLMALRVHEWNSKFLKYSILQNAEQIKAAASGLIPGLSRSDILEQIIPVPPRKEQAAIANALSDVDALINELEKLIAKKQAIKTATMQQLLTGRTRLPQFALRQDGTLKGYKQSELGEIPEDWEVDKIDKLISITTGNKNTQDRIDDGAYPFFVRSQTVERINSYSFDGEGVLTAGDGVGTGKIFHYVNGKFDYHQRVYLMHSFGEKVDGYYFFVFFSNHFYDRIMSMTAKSSVDSVRREMIADMLMTLPSKEEQTAIATILSDMDADIQTLQQRLSKTRQIKQGMMQALLTGRIRLITG